MHVAVIGRGLIGSAAARHLAEMGAEVTLIGPPEPADKATHQGVFASHYDEGRITRSLDPWTFWSRASRASIARYARIEAASGVRFFTDVGLMMAGPAGSGPVRQVAELAVREGIACETLDAGGLAERFGYFAFDRPTQALLEPRNAGYISPRRLVAAQTAAARKAGVTLVEEIALGIDETPDGVRIRTAQGALCADGVLVAAGGFTPMLLGGAVPLTVYARTVAFFEVSEATAAGLARMPPLIYLKPAGEDFYLLPPIRYPDGRWYLKMGGDPQDAVLPDSAAVKDWFRGGGAPEVEAHLEAAFRARMPGVEVLSVSRAACVTSFTPENIPHLKRVSARVAVAAGACGRGAKCSDEIGRLGALLATGQDLPAWAHEPATEGVTG